MSATQQPSKKCAFCGEGFVCQHGKCNVCQKCRTCERLDDAWDDLGAELGRMGKEEPGW